MTGAFHPGSDNLGGKNKGMEAITCEMGGSLGASTRSKKEKKNRVQLLLFVVLIGIHNMLHQQVDLGSVPLSQTDLLCNKR